MTLHAHVQSPCNGLMACIHKNPRPHGNLNDLLARIVVSAHRLTGQVHGHNPRQWDGCTDGCSMSRVSLCHILNNLWPLATLHVNPCCNCTCQVACSKSLRGKQPSLEPSTYCHALAHYALSFRTCHLMSTILITEALPIRCRATMQSPLAQSRCALACSTDDCTEASCQILAACTVLVLVLIADAKGMGRSTCGIRLTGRINGQLSACSLHQAPWPQCPP